MSPSAYAALKWKAAHLQKSDELAAELLEAIISSDIYEAVLDDDVRPPPDEGLPERSAGDRAAVARRII